MKPYWIVFLFCLLPLAGFAQDSLSVQDNQNERIVEAKHLMSEYQFEKALHLLNDCPNQTSGVLILRGQCNVQLGAYAGAIMLFENVLQVDSTNVVSLNSLAQLYNQEGEYEKAFEYYSLLIKQDSANSYYYKKAGSLAAQLGKEEAAITWYEKGLALNPADIEASIALGNIFLEQEDYQKIDGITSRVLEYSPEYKPALLLKARSAIGQHEYREAVKTLDQFLLKADTTMLVARLLCVSYFNLGEYEKLTEVIQFLLQSQYEAEWMYYYMGVAVQNLGNTKASLDWFNLAIKKSISQNIAKYFKQLAHSYEEMGDYENAIKSYKAAYHYSNEGILLYHLARNYDIYYKDKSTALLYYEKYLQSEDTIRLTRNYAKQRMQDAGKF